MSVLHLGLYLGQITRNRIPSSYRSPLQSSQIRTLVGPTIEMIVRFVVLVLKARARVVVGRRAMVANIVTSFRGQGWIGL